MQKIFIVMKNGIVHQINKKIDAMWLHKLLNDGGPFILLEGKGSINKFEISHTFEAGNNPILEKMAHHPLREQELLWGIIKLKKASWFPVKSYDALISAYHRMIKDKEIDNVWWLPFSIDSRVDSGNLALNNSQDVED